MVTRYASLEKLRQAWFSPGPLQHLLLVDNLRMAILTGEILHVSCLSLSLFFPQNNTFLFFSWIFLYVFI